MKIHHDCIPCFIRHSLEQIRQQVEDEKIREVLLRKILALLSDIDFRLTPPEIARHIHSIIRSYSHKTDPFQANRREQNRIALNLLPGLRTHLQHASDPWVEAVKLSIAGNAIDLGVYQRLSRNEIENSILTVLDQSLETGKAEQLKTAVDKAKSVLYLGDNAGEIVFDMLLIEQIPLDKVCFVVRGGPALNDVLLEDAQAVGLTDLVEVIDNGSDIPGTVLDECSEAFCRRFEAADLVIAKGQGNYETLSDEDKNIYFLFKVKCPVIAAYAGVELDRLTIYRG